MIVKNKWKLDKQIRNSKDQRVVKKSLGEMTRSTYKEMPQL